MIRWPLYIHTYISSTTSPPLPLTVDRLEERCESFKKESSDLHNRNIDLVKKHQVLKKESTLKRDRSDSRNKFSDEVPASPLTNRAPGFQDFMSPQQDGKKKRQLPIAPRRRPRAESADEGEHMCTVFVGVVTFLYLRYS